MQTKRITKEQIVDYLADGWNVMGIAGSDGLYSAIKKGENK